MNNTYNIMLKVIKNYKICFFSQILAPGLCNYWLIDFGWSRILDGVNITLSPDFVKEISNSSSRIVIKFGPEIPVSFNSLLPLLIIFFTLLIFALKSFAMFKKN